MAVAEAKKLIEEFNGKAQIVSMASYNKGYDAGCSLVAEDLIGDLSKVYAQRESLGADYCMGVIDGALTVVEPIIDSFMPSHDNCAA